MLFGRLAAPPKGSCSDPPDVTIAFMTGGSIFISYRREDSAGEAGRLAEHLVRRFGADRVFIDIDTIAPGADFVDELGRALNGTAVVLVVIGRQWLSASNADGSRRLDDPNDFVRREIETALAKGTRVIPVLVQNVTMPPASALPSALSALAIRQAMMIQHEEFSDDAQRLADSVAPSLGASTARAAALSPVTSRRSLFVALAVAAVIAVTFLAVRAQRETVDTALAKASVDSVKTAKQRLVDDLVKVASDQRERLQFADAMTTLDSAVALPANVSRAKLLQEDVAMQWIRDLRVGEGQTFGDAMARPLVVLDRAAPFASGVRQGDLLAHLGWAVFLRWRDGDRRLRPLDAYRQALAADSLNPFANVFLGHWLLSYDSGPDAVPKAGAYFATALRSGRETEQVRRFQMSALKNDLSVASRLEIVRVMNEMRVQKQSLPAGSARNAWSIYYFALNGQASLTVSDLMQVLPAAEHLETYRWAFADEVSRDESKGTQFRFYVARLRAETPESGSAVDSLLVLRKELGSDPGMLHDAVIAALKELKPRVPK